MTSQTQAVYRAHMAHCLIISGTDPVRAWARARKTYPEKASS